MENAADFFLMLSTVPVRLPGRPDEYSAGPEEIGRIPVWVPEIKGATEVEHAGDDVHNQAEYEQE